MVRNRNVDIFRAISLLMVMIYHGWVLTGAYSFKYSILALVFPLGGEIGVTAFFALSGYGIYFSLAGMEKKMGEISYVEFLKKRVKRIVPHYDLSIATVVLISISAYFSADGMLNIITHLLFVHNLFPKYSGSINGALWTMGVIVQFYLIAPILYQCLKRYGFKMEMLCIVGTVLMKWVIYAFVLPNTGHSGELEFFAGRQLITALDNFSIGMFAAYIIQEKKICMSGKTAVPVCILAVIEIVCVCKAGMMYGIHTNNISGYLWHSLLALGLGGIIFSISFIKQSGKSMICKLLLWLAKYEYGIYIWHLLILSKMIDKFSWFQKSVGISDFRWIGVFYIPVSIVVGYVFSWGLEVAEQKGAGLKNK